MQNMRSTNIRFMIRSRNKWTCWKKTQRLLMSDPACKLSASLFEPTGNLSRDYLKTDPQRQVLSEFIWTSWEFWRQPRIVSYISICLCLSFFTLSVFFLTWCKWKIFQNRKILHQHWVFWMWCNFAPQEFLNNRWSWLWASSDDKNCDWHHIWYHFIIIKEND